MTTKVVETGCIRGVTRDVGAAKRIEARITERVLKHWVIIGQAFNQARVIATTVDVDPFERTQRCARRHQPNDGGGIHGRRLRLGGADDGREPLLLNAQSERSFSPTRRATDPRLLLVLMGRILAAGRRGACPFM